jgi:hypothetical protein
LAVLIARVFKVLLCIIVGVTTDAFFLEYKILDGVEFFLSAT